MILREYLSKFLIVARVSKPFLARINEVSKFIPEELLVTPATFLLVTLFYCFLIKPYIKTKLWSVYLSI